MGVLLVQMYQIEFGATDDGPGGATAGAIVGKEIGERLLNDGGPRGLFRAFFVFRLAQFLKGASLGHSDRVRDLCRPSIVLSGDLRAVPRADHGDLRISLICRDNGVPLLSIARPPRWLGFNIQEGLWEQFRNMVTHHTHVMRESRPWTFPRFAAMVTSMFERYFGGFSRDAAQIRKFDTEVAAAILGGWIPPGWDTTIIGLNTRSRHLRTFGQ